MRSTNESICDVVGSQSSESITTGIRTLKAMRVPINWDSNLPIYASEPFLRSVGDEYGWIAGIDASGEQNCLLPYTVIRKLGFRIVRFRVETIPLKGGVSLESERSFLNSALEYFRGIGADMIIPGTNAALFRTYPNGATAAPYGTLLNNLQQPEEALFSSVHADYRKKIRSAARAGVTVRHGLEHLDTAYNIIADTLKRSAAQFIKSSDDLKKTVASFGENVRVFIAEHEGVPQACLISPFSQHTAYTCWGGTIAEPVKGAMHLLHWEAMRHYRTMGVRQFNFQGVRINPEPASKQEGILTFKTRFGGQLVQGYTWKYGFGRLKWAAYTLAVRLLKGGDIVDRERHKLAALSTVC